MSAKPVLTKVTHYQVSNSSMVYLHPFLTNRGSETLKKGHVICKKNQKMGQFKPLTHLTTLELFPVITV
jgi:hypothetical protein